MGKGKSELDRNRDEFFQREMRRRNSLKGPFRCPSCLAEDKLQVNTKRVVKTEKYTPEGGETRDVPVEYARYFFSCRMCDFKKIVINKGNINIIRTYNDLYDSELTPKMREDQIRMVRPTKIKTIELPQCEVRMR